MNSQRRFLRFRQVFVGLFDANCLYASFFFHDATCHLCHPASIIQTSFTPHLLATWLQRQVTCLLILDPIIDEAQSVEIIFEICVI